MIAIDLATARVQEMASTRRAVLTTGAAAVIVLAGAGAGWTMTRAPLAARAPWREAAEGFDDPRLDALAYAILAPNPHNMQPWLVRLEGDDSLAVFCDLDRLLPETDPPNRQITIGFGCFLELLRQAAAESGFQTVIDPFPDGQPQPNLDERPIARVTFVAEETVVRDPLFRETLARRTNRRAFEPSRSVGETELSELLEATVPGVEAFASADAAQVAELRRLAVEAWRIEWSTPRLRRESIEVMRIGKSEINAHPYGLNLGGPVLDALGAFGLLTRATIDRPATAAYREASAAYETACNTAAAFVWTTTATNSRLDQLNAGRAWVRIQLAAQAAGLAFHPLSQALQEYPEMTELYAAARQMLTAREGETVQMLARLGYAGDVPPSPRHAVMSRLITS